MFALSAPKKAVILNFHMASDESSDYIKVTKIAYLMNLLRTQPVLPVSDSDFEDIGDITSLLTMMLSPTLSDNYLSDTTVKQQEVEDSIRSIYEELSEKDEVVRSQPFAKLKHFLYVQDSLTNPLGPRYFGYDATLGWLTYWLLNANAVIGEMPNAALIDLVLKKVNCNIVQLNGKVHGVGGGVHQLGHAASTYASILSLVLIEDWLTLAKIKESIYTWLLNLKQPNGSFKMLKYGESDTRSTYCVLVIASLLNILTPELTENTLQWLNSCQTYEGGFAGVPDAEAHGGYTFCAFASYFILLGENSPDEFRKKIQQNVDIESLLRWSVMKQLQLEGGFCGRTNKLVDACYSFWVGAIFPLLECVLNEKDLFNREALKVYILNCAQDPEGGFKDKPSTRKDFYHTNYTLAGLSIAENYTSIKNTDDPIAYSFSYEVVDDENVHTKPVNPVFAVPDTVAEKCFHHMKTRV